MAGWDCGCVGGGYIYERRSNPIGTSHARVSSGKMTTTPEQPREPSPYTGILEYDTQLSRGRSPFSTPHIQCTLTPEPQPLQE
jgi:hypothetical protein